MKNCLKCGISKSRLLGRQFYYCLAGIGQCSFTVVAYGGGGAGQLALQNCKGQKPERHVPRPCLCDKAEVKRVRLICM